MPIKRRDIHKERLETMLRLLKRASGRLTDVGNALVLAASKAGMADREIAHLLNVSSQTIAYRNKLRTRL